MYRYCYSQTRQWTETIQDSYGHSVYRLTAEKGNEFAALDLVHMNHWLFGNSLVSMPFSDTGGFTGRSEELEPNLLRNAMSIAVNSNIPVIELRMDRVLPWLSQDFLCTSGIKKIDGQGSPWLSLKTHKVRMVLELPKSPELLMAGFKSKLRSQIKKPIKEGMIKKIGKRELIEDFYSVFTSNMRDLGSPVHAKKLFVKILKHFQERADLIIVYKSKRPVAGAMVVGNDKILSNPWASSLKEYRSFSPNMLLYWEMMKYAIERGYKQFDFGRSTPGEGTHTFKEQWGSKEEKLYWYRIFLKGNPSDDTQDEQSSFSTMIKIWQMMPVGLTTLLGPSIRKSINL